MRQQRLSEANTLLLMFPTSDHLSLMVQSAAYVSVLLSFFFTKSAARMSRAGQGTKPAILHVVARARLELCAL